MQDASRLALKMVGNYGFSDLGILIWGEVFNEEGGKLYRVWSLPSYPSCACLAFQSLLVDLSSPGLFSFCWSELELRDTTMLPRSENACLCC